MTFVDGATFGLILKNVATIPFGNFYIDVHLCIEFTSYWIYRTYLKLEFIPSKRILLKQ